MEERNIIINAENGKLTANFDEMKEYLAAKLEEYKGAVFTDDSIKVAKKVVAGLRADQTAFKTRIKEVKAAYMKPFDEFKAKADELVTLYDEPINFINGQVQDFEARRKEEKHATCVKAFTEIAPQYAHLVDRVYKSEWDNTTYTMAKVKADIAEIVQKIDTDLATLGAYGDETYSEATEIYMRELNLQPAIAYIKTYEDAKRRAEERARAEEIERVKREERERFLAEQKAAEEKARAEAEKMQAVEEAKAQAANDVVEALTPEDKGEKKMYTYNVALTEEGKKSFEMYMDSVGLDYICLTI